MPAGIEQEIPGYHAALAREAEARDFAFLPDLPQTLCGVPVLPLDLRHLVLLTHAGNAFVAGGAADIEDCRMILWLPSPLYVAGDAAARRRFLLSLPRMEEAAAVAEVRAWIDRTFSDAPPNRRRPAGGEGAVIEEPIASFVASWVDLIASEYGYSVAAIVGTPQKVGMPLVQLYQLHRCCVRRHDPKHPFGNAVSARMLGEWLRASIKAEEEAAAKA